jgi:hypothetical protein
MPSFWRLQNRSLWYTLVLAEDPLLPLAMVITAMAEGVDNSADGRIFGHHHTTITRLIERCGYHGERLHQQLFHRALSNGHLQLDELVNKVKQDAERI